MRFIWDDEEVADEPLWRYFNTERFLQLLQTKHLHFPSARQFNDPFEGAVAVLPHDWPSDPRYPDLGDGDRAFEELRRLTKVSCWHKADYESDAMWKLYAAGRKGIAVRTTTMRLKAALQPFRLAPKYGEEEPFWGNVRYVDLHAVRLRVNMEQRLFYKHRAFEWEREFRVAISVRGAEEYGVSVPEFGINVAVAPAILIESIHLGPELLPSDAIAIQDACAAIAFPAKPVVSTLLGKPRYV